MTQQGRPSTPWSADELAVLHDCIERRLSDAEVIASIPTRTMSAIIDKARRERKALGIPRPIGRKRKYDQGPSPRPKLSAGDYDKRAEMERHRLAADGSRMLLEAYYHYHARHVAPQVSA